MSDRSVTSSAIPVITTPDKLSDECCRRCERLIGRVWSTDCQVVRCSSIVASARGLHSMRLCIMYYYYYLLIINKLLLNSHNSMHSTYYRNISLADRTNGRAYGTIFCPSVVCRLFVTHVLWLNGICYRKLSEEANRVARPPPYGTNSDPLRTGVPTAPRILALRPSR